MPQDSIIDTTKPNAGRIYDYLLGGSHNFEVDRQAADQLVKFLPFLPKAMRLQRWCLQDLAVELTEKRSFDVIIDFASGLPTNDHMHVVARKGTTVIYSDYDPVVVEYAHEILKGTPNVYFFHADARRPEELLFRPEVQGILGGRRDVALVYWGVTMFLTDEDLSHAARALAEWSSKSSCWAFQAQGAVATPDDPSVSQVVRAYERMGSPMYFRPLERFQQLLQPWHADEKGFVSMVEWHGFDQTMLSQEDQQAWGQGGGNFGAYLVK
jgi:hypothetical protein